MPASEAHLLPLILLGVFVGGTPAKDVLTIRADRGWSPSEWKAAGPVLVEPVWTRQNIWRPWKQWRSHPPEFAPYMREAALVMATGLRPNPNDSIDNIEDLYRESPEGTRLPFDPGHPFFFLLQHLRKSGIKPVIDLGPVPRPLSDTSSRARAGAFDFGIRGPRDSAAYERYFGFIRDLFLFLQSPGYFTRAEIESWEFQLLREPDNPDAWDPWGKGGFNDKQNLEEYLKLYDWTLAGLRAAGIRKNLSFGNLAVPHAGNMGIAGSWMGILAAWLASEAPPRCRHLSLPRLLPGDTLTFSFTGYGAVQLTQDPRDIARVTNLVRKSVLPAFPKQDFRITVGEGNLMLVPGNHRGDGTELGAAWTAALFKNALDAGLHRYQQWGFSSGGHISILDPPAEVMPAAYNVVEMFRRMQGSLRLETSAMPARNRKETLDGLAARDSSGRIRILAYHFTPDRNATRSGLLELRVAGLEKGRRYRLIRRSVHRERGNYYPAWMEARGKEAMPGDPHDALVGWQLTPRQAAIWAKSRQEFQQLSAQGMEPEPGDQWRRAGATGSLTRTLNLPPNSVVLLELEPSP